MTAMDTTISQLLANRTPVDTQRGWPRYRIDSETWSAIGQALGAAQGDLVALWGDRESVHMALRERGQAPCIVSIPVTEGVFPSIGRHHLPAIRPERAVRDLYGHIPHDAPDNRPWLDHGAWGVSAPLGANEPAPLRDPADYRFLPVEGRGLHQIPVGPVHAGIIEPGHFRFTANGETVVRLEERLGYVHKGIDGLLTGADIGKAARVIGRVSGDSTVAYSFAFAQAVECALGIEAPPRAQVLRGVMAEVERIANHFGDIGAICNDASFALAFAYCGMFREELLQATDRAFGHRLMMDCIVPGGLANDVSRDAASALMITLDGLLPRFAEIAELYDETPSLQDRTCTTGIVHRDLVTQWAAGGYVGRASGRDFDVRRDAPYRPYLDLPFVVPVLAQGDVDARVRIRIAEIEESARLIKTLVLTLPEGPVSAELPQSSEMLEGTGYVEGFRGDVFVWVRLRGSRVETAHARDPSCFQWPLLEAAIENNIVADFPLCNKSFNCTYSGHDL
jgi:Ni,Fe-hydrogenase III large subunit